MKITSKELRKKWLDFYKKNEWGNVEPKTFDEELFGSPKPEMDYYKADFLFEKNEYLDANRYILAAIKEEPNNEKYKVLAEKIKSKLIDIELENYNNAQKLFNDKRFEDSVKLLDSIYVVEKGEEEATDLIYTAEQLAAADRCPGSGLPPGLPPGFRRGESVEIHNTVKYQKGAWAKAQAPLRWF